MDPIRACSIPGCDRTNRITKNLCSTHYARFLRHGDPGGSSIKTRAYAGATCSVVDCARVAKSNGLCMPHYKRVRRSGSVDGYQPQPIALYMRERTRVGPTPSDRPGIGPCHLWVGTIGGNGYGYVNLRPGKRLAHRVAFELDRGEIPAGLHLDHLCRVRTCVNPEHLEPVTNEENLRRGFGFRLRNGMDSKCINGHEYTPENTYRNPNKNNDVRCRTCARIRNRKRAA